MSFPAKYPGQCGSCTDRIRVDDPVHYVEDVLCHVECESVPEEKPTKYQGTSLEDMGF